MDPKLSNLDPKLQDAYKRVMGHSATGENTNQPPPQQTSQPQAPAPAPQAPNPAPPASSPVPETPRPPEPIPSAPSTQIPGVNSTMAFNADDSHKNIGTTPVKKGGLHIMPIAIGLGIVLLLVVYTFVWIILFNVRVPFLPQL